MYTTQQAADQLGLKRTTVQKWARVLGFKKIGRDIFLTDDDIIALREREDKRYGKRTSSRV